MTRRPFVDLSRSTLSTRQTRPPFHRALCFLDASRKLINLREYPKPTLLSIDHIYPPPSTTLATPSKTAIFYATLSSPNFRDLYTTLLSLAQKPGPHRIQYVVRYVPPPGRDTAPKSYLSGYSVSMDLKKMDYLAMDDRRTRSSDDTAAEDGPADDESAQETEDNEATRALQTLVDSLDEQEKATPLTKEEIAGARILAMSSPVAHATQNSGFGRPK